MGINKWELSNRHSTRWLFLSTISHSNWNLECWFLWREETLRAWRKTLGVEMRTNNNLNPHVLPGLGMKPSYISYKVLSVVLEETEN